MVQVSPFKALVYNPRKIKKYEDVLVPPYDVISQSEKKEFFKKSTYNFTRITLGEKENNYRKVSERFKAWRKQEIFVSDGGNYFYFLEQAFIHQGRKIKRRGIAACVRLDDFKNGKILPHEKTFLAPTLDRLKILKACQANLEPIFMMYQDMSQKLEKSIVKYCKQPFITSQDRDGVHTRVWRIEDPYLIHLIQKVLGSKTFYIVDGHHRFATALQYQKKQRKKDETVLTVITNMSDPALVIDPIYRALPKNPNFNKEDYLKKLSDFFVIKKKNHSKAGRLSSGQWGILFSKDPYFYELKLKNKKSFLSHLHGRSQKLDVFILQNHILPQDLIKHIHYFRGIGDHFKDALKYLHQGKFEAVWFVKAPNVLDVKNVADHHEIMPQKSTYFYPKLPSGAFIRLLN